MIDITKNKLLPVWRERRDDEAWQYSVLEEDVGHTRAKEEVK